MIAEAYAYADGEGDIPKELKALFYVDRFGVQSIYGRPLYYHEVRRFEVAEMVVKAYLARKNSSNMAQWAKDNPRANALLEIGIRLNG